MSSKKNDYLLTGNKYVIPEVINEECRGIQLGNHHIRSILLTTDLSYILNLNADAIMVVNPFNKSDVVNRVIIEHSPKPVICDVGGGFLKERSTIELAKKSFEAGAAAVLISKPTSADTIRNMRKEISGTLIYTMMYQEEPIEDLAEAGVDIFNISTGVSTAETVEIVRNKIPETPIMANGGPYDSTIYETIEMGANAIVINPPTATEMLRTIFDSYRVKKD